MIYLDYAASSPVLPEASAAALRFMTEEYANPSSIHQAAEKSREVIGRCRRKIAEMLGCRPEEIIFTSGGTESNNLAIFGAGNGKIRHIITAAIEHESVLRAAKAWKNAAPGRKLVILEPDRFGRISAESVEAAISEALSFRASEASRGTSPDLSFRASGASRGIPSGNDTPSPSEILVSVMTANNELGTVEPIRELGAVCKKYGVLFHTDAVQAFAHIPLSVRECGIDYLSASGHKFGAPKGVGFLYAGKAAGLQPLLYGGGQERGQRSGTLNTPGIAGMLAALEYCSEHMASSAKRISALRDAFLREVLEALPDTVVNSPLFESPQSGSAAKSTEKSGPPALSCCLPGHLNLSFPGVEAESLLIHLDLYGIAASAGSACASGSLEPSHVLMALPGMTEERANGSLRFSFGEFTREEECSYAARKLIESVKKLRMLRYG